MTQLDDIILTIKEANLALENYEKMFQTVDENFKKSFVEAVNFICENEFFREARRKRIIEVGLNALHDFDEYFKNISLINIMDKVNLIIQKDINYHKIGLLQDAAVALESYEDIIEKVDVDFSTQFYKNVNFLYTDGLNNNIDQKEITELADKTLEIFKQYFKNNEHIIFTDNSIHFI